MTNIQRLSLPVDGVTLAYTLRGTGPFLLLIPGGEGGGEGFHLLAEALSDRYTVVTYDRRGALGSPVDPPGQDVRLETHTGDAHHLLATLTSEPAYLFGSSAGALVGLDLMIQHPEQVRMLVAHEPPVEGILPSFDQSQNEIADAIRAGDGPTALQLFFSRTGLQFNDLEPGVVLPPRNPQEALLRGQALMRYTFPAVHRYRVDVEALRGAAEQVPLVIGVSSSGQQTPVYQCTLTLADRLGKQVAVFPSHHSGYITYPRAFAARLEEVLQGGDR
jgi:pimeloyl-ACP methyl ester carboxylesterase